MYQFLLNNRQDLIDRCKAKVAKRPHRGATDGQLSNGVPLFLDQLTRTLLAEEGGEAERSLQISGASGGEFSVLSEMGVTATAHGKDLLALGFSVDHVVHDYGDLCQAITDLAFERDAPFTVDQFRTLNRCLDNAIADAVTSFGAERDVGRALQQAADESERLGVLVHELRNYLQVAGLAFRALESGQLPVGGSTGGVLKRSLASMSALLLETMNTVRLVNGLPAEVERFQVESMLRDAVTAVRLAAAERGCTIALSLPGPLVFVNGNRNHLMAALVNLLQNAVKFTHTHTTITVDASAADGLVSVAVADHCGGLPAGLVDKLFKPFTRSDAPYSGTGLGLSIARKSVEAAGGTISVANVPGTGCIFTIELPRSAD
ncbi:hypothetical protein BH09PSE6_BH09PSE6_19650 [soil metagenome]